MIHRSDRGSQYASGSFQQQLARYGITCSLNHLSDCYDNAMVESFFGPLKTGLDDPLPDGTTARQAFSMTSKCFAIASARIRCWST